MFQIVGIYRILLWAFVVFGALQLDLAAPSS